MVFKLHKDFEFCNKIKIYFIELPKFRLRKYKDYNDKVEQWLTFIDDESMEEVNKVMEKNDLIKNAKMQVVYYTGDEEVQRM